MSTREIYNYRKVDESLITAGQPTADQLQAAAAEGFKTVINLATLEPPYALADEAGLVQSLGMDYYHIPVEWENPKLSDFEAFERLMTSLPDRKILVHCVANFRVTAFYSLYAMKHLGWSEAQAGQFRAQIWEGSDWPVWEKFIADLEAQFKA